LKVCVVYEINKIVFFISQGLEITGVLLDDIIDGDLTPNPAEHLLKIRVKSLRDTENLLGEQMKYYKRLKLFIYIIFYFVGKSIALLQQCLWGRW
jgi:hypothetical protein